MAVVSALAVIFAIVLGAENLGAHGVSGKDAVYPAGASRAGHSCP